MPDPSYLRREEEREENVRRRIATMRKPPARSSREYEDIFRQLMDEEYLREGIVRLSLSLAIS